MKKCPYCAEEIQDDAIICKHCGKELVKKKEPFPLWLILIGLIILVISMAISIGDNNGNSGGVSPTRKVATSRQITYKITGSSDMGNLTYQTDGGGVEQIKARIPFTKEYPMFPIGGFAYLSVQNDNKSGSVTCEIYLDGMLWKTSSSSGAYKIATCSDRVP